MAEAAVVAEAALGAVAAVGPVPVAAAPGLAVEALSDFREVVPLFSALAVRTRRIPQEQLRLRLTQAETPCL